LRLYEEYTDSTMEPGSTQTTGKTTIKPPATGAKPKEQFIREVNFYSTSNQEQVAHSGWINLLDFDNIFKKFRGSDGTNMIGCNGNFYDSKLDAIEYFGSTKKNGKPIPLLYWIFRGGDLGDNGNPKNPNFQLNIGPREDNTSGKVVNLYNRELNKFLRDRYLQKNSSGVWVRKVESGGFADNSSVDIPDKFA
jgi:hypothetical protein